MKDLKEIAATIDSLPNVLELLLRPVDQAWLTVRPEPQEWSVLEVIGHLVATDSDGFRKRILNIIEGNPEIVAFDPWEAIHAREHKTLTLVGLLDELSAERKISVQFVNDLEVASLSRCAEYGDSGTFAAADFVHEWPFHDQDHIQQILDILKQSYIPHMSSTMRRALRSDEQ